MLRAAPERDLAARLALEEQPVKAPISCIHVDNTERQQPLLREAEQSRRIADYLTQTGFKNLGDVVACDAAPPRSETTIELSVAP